MPFHFYRSKTACVVNAFTRFHLLLIALGVFVCASLGFWFFISRPVSMLLLSERAKSLSVSREQAVLQKILKKLFHVQKDEQKLRVELSSLTKELFTPRKLYQRIVHAYDKYRVAIIDIKPRMQKSARFLPYKRLYLSIKSVGSFNDFLSALKLVSKTTGLLYKNFKLARRDDGRVQAHIGVLVFIQNVGGA